MNTHLATPASDQHLPPSEQSSRPFFDPRYRISFFMVTALFFLWALPNNLNDVLIRQFMKSFQISRLQAGLVQSAFYLGYFCVSMPAAFVLRRFGYRWGLVAGLVLYAFGCLLFWPAAVINQYGFFLLALFIIASGLAFLETGAASFIAQLGDADTSERRLNFAQSFNPPGTIAGALIGTIFIFSGVEPTALEVQKMKDAGVYPSFLHHETLRVVMPYLILGALIFFAALILSRVPFPPRPALTPDAGAKKLQIENKLFLVPHFRWAVIAQFFYVGAQVATWSFLIQYVEDYTHQSEKIAGLFLSATLGLFAMGRFVSTLLMKFFRPHNLMGTFSIINIFLLAIAIGAPGWAGLWALMLTSFFMSLMYPTIFALGLKRLGPQTTLASSLLVMAIIGGAVITPIVGFVAEYAQSMATALAVPVACYAVVAYFSFFAAQATTPSTHAL